MNRHREEDELDGCLSFELNLFDDVPSHFNAVPHHPRSCSAFAGRDSLRSVGHAANAAGFSGWNIAWRFEDDWLR